MKDKRKIPAPPEPPAVRVMYEDVKFWKVAAIVGVMTGAYILIIGWWLI